MDVHHVGEFAERGMFTHQDRDLLNDVGCVGTIGVAAEDLVSRGYKEFQHTLRGVHREGLCRCI